MTKTYEPGLYPRLLGPAWDQLSPGIREAHAGTTHCALSGVFRIEVGAGLLAWLSRLVMRVPLSPQELPARLLIRPSHGAERWERAIGPWKFSTHQQEHRQQLRESYGPLLFDFRLDVLDGALHYSQVAFGIGLGPLRLPIPKVLAVRVAALEEPASDQFLTRIAVRVDLPVVGLLVAYSGTLGRS